MFILCMSYVDLEWREKLKGRDFIAYKLVRVGVTGNKNNHFRPMATVFIASRALGHHYDTQTPRNHPSEHPKMFVRNYVKSQFQAFN